MNVCLMAFVPCISCEKNGGWQEKEKTQADQDTKK